MKREQRRAEVERLKARSKFLDGETFACECFDDDDQPCIRCNEAFMEIDDIKRQLAALEAKANDFDKR